MKVQLYRALLHVHCPRKRVTTCDVFTGVYGTLRIIAFIYIYEHNHRFDFKRSPRNRRLLSLRVRFVSLHIYIRILYSIKSVRGSKDTLVDGRAEESKKDNHRQTTLCNGVGWILVKCLVRCFFCCCKGCLEDASWHYCSSSALAELGESALTTYILESPSVEWLDLQCESDHRPNMWLFWNGIFYKVLWNKGYRNV